MKNPVTGQLVSWYSDGNHFGKFVRADGAEAVVLCAGKEITLRLRDLEFVGAKPEPESTTTEWYETPSDHSALVE